MVTLQICVLTGDKEETAVNVSFSAGHITDTMTVFSLTGQHTWRDCESILDTVHRK